jgi:urease accessory protein
MIMNKMILALLILLAHPLVKAHDGTGEGFLHPLTGLDHLLAMLAVGAWSAQIGGRAIYSVPSAFVGMMVIGAFIGLEQINLPYSELGSALSIVLLGTAIAFNRQAHILIASVGVALFGVFHGFAHGVELPQNTEKISYVVGFLLTTASLHAIGAFATLITLKKTYGKELLKAVGFITLLIGVNFIFLIELKN